MQACGLPPAATNDPPALVALADGRHLVALGLRALSGCLADGNEHGFRNPLRPLAKGVD
jgi:hypothetical protein